MNFDLCGFPQHKPRTRQRSVQFARRLAAIAVRALAVASNAAEALLPAQRLYASVGFEYGGPFAGHAEDPDSVFMSLRL